MFAWYAGWFLYISLHYFTTLYLPYANIDITTNDTDNAEKLVRILNIDTTAITRHLTKLNSIFSQIKERVCYFTIEQRFLPNFSQ